MSLDRNRRKRGKRENKKKEKHKKKIRKKKGKNKKNRKKVKKEQKKLVYIGTILWMPYLKRHFLNQKTFQKLYRSLLIF